MPKTFPSSFWFGCSFVFVFIYAMLVSSYAEDKMDSKKQINLQDMDLNPVQKNSDKVNSTQRKREIYSASSERFIRDDIEGIALYGYDPIAYYTDHREKMGEQRFQSVWGGALWYFSNEGNQAVFMKHPDFYAPRFGGYGAMAAARGYIASGDPTIWALYDNQLYFFYSKANRYAWLTDPKKFSKEGKRNWKSLSKKIVH